MPAVYNRSTVVSDADVRLMVAACDVQMKRDFAPAHELVPWDLNFGGRGFIHIYVVDEDRDVPGALAYHDYQNGHPVGVVLAKTILDNGGDVFGPSGISVALSHEYLETRLDPFCNDLGDGFWKEACDAVQDQAYQIADVYVSNFCLKHWWTPGSPGPWDYMRRLSRPQQIGPGGYQVHYTMDGGSTVYGDKPPYHGWRGLSRG